MRKLILLNGPMGCGKTEAVKYMQSQGINLQNRRCKDKLFELTARFFCISDREFFHIYNNRGLKEKPNKLFWLTVSAWSTLKNYLGKPALVAGYHQARGFISVREAMIYVSEFVCKPAFGNEYFGIARVKSMSDDEIAIDDSTGFTEELRPALHEVGQDNVLLIRIHGRGTFEGDSRAYIPNGVVTHTVDVYNTTTEQEFQKEILTIVQDFLGV